MLTSLFGLVNVAPVGNVAHRRIVKVVANFRDHTRTVLSNPHETKTWS